jgi:hypothetical protein
MKKLAPFALAAFAFANVAGAQEQAAPQMVFVVQDVVSPAHMAAYETGTKAFLRDLAATPGARETLAWTAVSGPEVGYYYVIPIESWTALGEGFAAWEAAGTAMGSKWTEHMAANQAHVEETATMVIMLRPDLSHNLDRTALTPENAYRHYTWWYPQPNKTQEAEAVAREYIALFQARGLEDGWRVYQTVMGPDQPAYLVLTTAPDKAAYNTRDAEITAILGEDGMKLQAKAMSLARRMTMSEGWMRPDLSFPPAPQQMGAK